MENWATIPAVESLDVRLCRLSEGTVVTDPQTLRERAIDSWALAMLRQVRGDELLLPAAVIFPASTDDVATALAWASETKTAVIPRGAGSGVVGGGRRPSSSSAGLVLGAAPPGSDDEW